MVDRAIENQVWVEADWDAGVITMTADIPFGGKLPKGISTSDVARKVVQRCGPLTGALDRDVAGRLQPIWAKVHNGRKRASAAFALVPS